MAPPLFLAEFSLKRTLVIENSLSRLQKKSAPPELLVEHKINLDENIWACSISEQKIPPPPRRGSCTLDLHRTKEDAEMVSEDEESFMHIPPPPGADSPLVVTQSLIRQPSTVRVFDAPLT